MKEKETGGRRERRRESRVLFLLKMGKSKAVPGINTVCTNQDTCLTIWQRRSYKSKQRTGSRTGALIPGEKSLLQHLQRRCMCCAVEHTTFNTLPYFPAFSLSKSDASGHGDACSRSAYLQRERRNEEAGKYF